MLGACARCRRARLPCLFRPRRASARARVCAFPSPAAAAPTAQHRDQPTSVLSRPPLTLPCAAASLCPLEQLQDLTAMYKSRLSGAGASKAFIALVKQVGCCWRC